MMELADLPDDLLMEECRRREIAWQDSQVEVKRRWANNGYGEWSEKAVGAILARKRNELHYRPKLGEFSPQDRMPPPLFRFGYEWAVLSVVELLDGILARASSDCSMSQAYEPVGKGLYRLRGKPVVSDPRRRAAFDLIEMIRSFYDNSMRGMWFVLPPLRSTFEPGEDEKTVDSAAAGGFKQGSDQAVTFGGGTH